MERGEVQDFRAQLQRAQQQLHETEQISRESAANQKLDKCAVGREARMGLLQARQVAEETERRRLLKLQRIEAALARLDSGDFGQCDSCGEAIDPRRLRSDPTIVTCIHCARAQ